MENLNFENNANNLKINYKINITADCVVLINSVKIFNDLNKMIYDHYESIID